MILVGSWSALGLVLEEEVAALDPVMQAEISLDEPSQSDGIKSLWMR